MTLREVLKVLQDQGLVESRRGRYGGTFVLPKSDAGGEDELRRRISAVDIEDVLRFREVLEVGATGLCATHGLDGEQAGRLRDALARTHDAPLADYRRLDTLLHLTLAELCGSPTLTAQYAAVRATVNDLLDCIPLLVRNLEHSQRQHIALVEAVLDGDADGAREMMREHCAGTAALLRGFSHDRLTSGVVQWFPRSPFHSRHVGGVHGGQAADRHQHVSGGRGTVGHLGAGGGPAAGRLPAPRPARGRPGRDAAPDSPSRPPRPSPASTAW